MTSAIARASSAQALRWRAPRLLSGPDRADQCIALDLYDWWHFQRLGAHDQALMQRLARTPELVPLAFDLYGVLYKPQPVWRKEAPPSLASAVLHVLEAQGELARIRQRTMLSEWATVMHLNALLEPVEKALQRGREAAQGPRRNARGAAQDAVALQAACRQASGIDAWVAARRHGGRAIDEAMDRYEQARAELAAFDRTHGLSDLPDRRGRKLRPFRMRSGRRTSPPEPPWQRCGVPDELGQRRDALVAAMRAARERVRALQEAQRALQARACEEIRQDPALRKALLEVRPRIEEALRLVDEVAQSMRDSDDWGREAGDVRRLPVEEFVRLSKTLRETPSVRKIVELAGRWTEVLKQRLSRGHSPRGRSELTGVTLGGGIERLLASELVKLRHPRLRRALLAQVVEQRALVQELRGPHVLGRGPVILVVDTSGSMSGARMVLAKSLMLALALHCWEKRRPLRVLTFGAPGELHEIEVPADEPFWLRFEQCLTLAFGGGTDFDGPLLRVCEIAGERPWRQADAVFVTDGECDVTAATRALLAETRTRVDLQIIGILVGGGKGLRGIADVAFRVTGADDRRGASLDASTWQLLECSSAGR